MKPDAGGLYKSRVSSDAEADRDWKTFHAEALPLREILIAKNPRMPDLVVFWLDAGRRPDLIDQFRLHETEKEGRIHVAPVLMFQRTPFQVKLGIDVVITAPAACKFRILYSYLGNKAFAWKIGRGGAFAVEVSTPTRRGAPPFSADMLRCTFEPDVSLQLFDHLRLADEIIQVARQDGVKIPRPLSAFQGHFMSTEPPPPPPPKVGRGKIRRG